MSTIVAHQVNLHRCCFFFARKFSVQEKFLADFVYFALYFSFARLLIEHDDDIETPPTTIFEKIIKLYSQLDFFGMYP